MSVIPAAMSASVARMNKTFSVWIDGGEVNSHYLRLPDAERIAAAWRDFGYEPIVTGSDPCLICGEIFAVNGLIICDTCGGDN